jgi:proteasome lid subunit RPN8/RPN11
VSAAGPESGDQRLRIAADLRRQLVEHARQAAPGECCGLLVGTSSRVVRCVPTANLDPSPSRYQVDPAAHIRLNRELRRSGLGVVGVYHSHPRGPAEPSPSDVAEAHYPEFVHIIVSSLEDDHPEIRAYRIIRGIVAPIRLEDESDGEPS